MYIVNVFSLIASLGIPGTQQSNIGFENKPLNIKMFIMTLYTLLLYSRMQERYYRNPG